LPWKASFGFYFALVTHCGLFISFDFFGDFLQIPSVRISTLSIRPGYVFHKGSVSTVKLSGLKQSICLEFNGILSFIFCHGIALKAPITAILCHNDAKEVTLSEDSS
jgi:hypothetical protein